MIVPDRQKIDERSRTTKIEQTRESTTSGAVNGERERREGGRANGGDPINSNGDEDIPNLSAIYRE